MDAIACFKALSDETRFKIFMKLKAQELCACQILESFQITQPTLSFHMKKLLECGLVIGQRDGIWMRYRINEIVVKEVLVLLENSLLPIESECEGKCSS
ncbi:MAG: metalloregulator ArsR/SmtB family transcription factor [Erysipelothrix sp.]|nr:metalloregulator ArsR/SmtB family transcription factor [Erysipelothrix sp.]